MQGKKSESGEGYVTPAPGWDNFPLPLEDHRYRVDIGMEGGKYLICACGFETPEGGIYTLRDMYRQHLHEVTYERLGIQVGPKSDLDRSSQAD